jgi:Radical SAM superfamily
MKKTFSWVQPHYRQGSKSRNNYYLPYSAGILWCYVEQFPELMQQYQLGEVVWKREPVADVVERLKHHDIVGFSTYVWNRYYNYEVARQLKLANPNCYIIFGGPEPPHTDITIFKNMPYIDCIVVKEGEVVLKNILENFGSQQQLLSVKGLILNIDGIAHDTGPAERINDLDSVPSPYLSGFFDKMIEDNPTYTWSAVFEPDRGCPYQCTYCDWGSMTYSKIKKFDLERLYAELEWFGAKGIRYIMVANANFGIFPERDHLITDKILEVRERTGFPYSMYISWAKNQKQEVINIAKKLKDLTGLAVSVQSLDPMTLKNVKRDNLAINKIEEIFKLCNLQNIPVHTEMILGLPGETLTSWKNGIYRLFEAGNHTSISFYTAQILQNSEMNLLQRKLHGIKSIHVRDFMAGAEVDEEIAETVEAVVETKTLPADDMLAALMFNLYINSFHVTGITTLVSWFLYKNQGVAYSDFYDAFYNYMQQDAWFANEIAEASDYYKTWVRDGKIGHPNIGETIEISGLNLHYRIAINIYHGAQREHVLSKLRDFVDQNYTLDTKIKDQLFKLQDLYFIDYNRIDQYPMTQQFDYDFVNYLVADAELYKPADYRFEYRGAKDSLEFFCEHIYYARRGQWTKARIYTVGQDTASIDE